MAEPTGRDRREYFRLVYPLACRPKVQLGYYVYEVFDVSEHGLKFLCDDFRFHPGMTAKGTITFKDGTAVQFEGQVLRVSRFDVAVGLNKPIPERIILAEQRFVIKKYFARDRH